MSFMLVLATAVIPPCPVGTMVTMTKAEQPPIGLRRLPEVLRFYRTETFRPVSASCRLTAQRFSPNTSEVRFDGGVFVSFLRGRSATLVAAAAPTPNGPNFDAEVLWSFAKACDPAAVDSTTYGPADSCAALYRDGRQSILRITRKMHSGVQSFSMKLPYRYTSVTAGGWAHAIGGELALGRQADDGAAAIVDVLTLLGN